MTHMPPSAAIFSPSVARIVTSTAKDWNHVDTWLSSKFHGRSPPHFERNAETLKTLVALAVFNESVDEDRELVGSAETPALLVLSKGANSRANEKETMIAAGTDAAFTSAPTVAGRILTAIEDSLPREGHVALDNLAATSVELGIAYPEPAELGRSVMELQARLFRLNQAASLNVDLRTYAETENSQSIDLLEEMNSNQYRPAADRARLNLELQRRVKIWTGRLQDAKERTTESAALAEATIPQLEKRERIYQELLEYCNDLDKKISAFQGLPPNKKLARQQLEELQAELQFLAKKRDVVFEGLVERASPSKTY